MSVRRITINAITVEYDSGGYPFWISVQHGGNELRLHHAELVDLEYAIARMKEQARKDLMPAEPHEADGIK